MGDWSHEQETSPATVGDTDQTGELATSILDRVVRWFRAHPEEMSSRVDAAHRSEAVVRHTRSFTDRFIDMDLASSVFALMDLFVSYLWQVLYASDLDDQGKRDAIVEAFAELASVASAKLSTATVVATRAAMDAGFPFLDLAMAEVQQRKGAKIAQARLDKIVTARDALSEVIDEAQAAEEEPTRSARMEATMSDREPGTTAPADGGPDRWEEFSQAIRAMSVRFDAMEGAIAELRGTERRSDPDGAAHGEPVEAEAPALRVVRANSDGSEVDWSDKLALLNPRGSRAMGRA